MSIVQERAILGKLRTRGYWRVVIRPSSFDKNHIPDASDLLPIIATKSVRLRGWDYPHIDSEVQNHVQRDDDWVGQEYDRNAEVEVWRLYRSGLFVHFFALAGEWRDESNYWTAEPGWRPGRHLYYIQTAYSLVEVFEFAARLALSPAGAAFMHVEIQLRGLKGRRLVSTDTHVPLSGDYLTRKADWNHTWHGSQIDLSSRSRELAAAAARDLYSQFGLNLSLDSIARIQERIGGR